MPGLTVSAARGSWSGNDLPSPSTWQRRPDAVGSPQKLAMAAVWRRLTQRHRDTKDVRVPAGHLTACAPSAPLEQSFPKARLDGPGACLSQRIRDKNSLPITSTKCSPRHNPFPVPDPVPVQAPPPV